MAMVVAKKTSNVVEAQYVEMKVPLYSYGCQKKINKALAHLKGIYSINVDFEQQKVTVWGICNKLDVLRSIRNKRKAACFWEPQGDEEEAVSESSEGSNGPAHSPNPAALGLIKFRSRSLSWKSLKKVFSRSYSF